MASRTLLLFAAGLFLITIFSGTQEVPVLIEHTNLSWHSIIDIPKETHYFKWAFSATIAYYLTMSFVGIILFLHFLFVKIFMDYVVIVEIAIYSTVFLSIFLIAISILRSAIFSTTLNGDPLFQSGAKILSYICPLFGGIPIGMWKANKEKKILEDKIADYQDKWIQCREQLLSPCRQCGAVKQTPPAPPVKT